MKGLLTACCALVVVFFSTVANADDTGLTLEKAVETALSNNGELAAARTEMGLREAAKLRAGQWPNPEIELEGAFADASENTVSAGVSQEILTGGKLRKRTLSADREIAAYSHVLEDAGRRLKEEVKQAYWDAVFASSAMELTEKSAELNRELAGVAGERFGEGDIPELELTLSKVELGRAEERKLKAESVYDEARARLFTLMGVPDDGVILAEPQLVIPDCNPEELKAAAIANRPDIRALAAASDKADADIEAANAERWPNVTASLFYERENPATDSGGSEQKDRANFVGLRLTIPVPLFDRNQGGVMEARTSKDAAVIRHDYLEEKVRKEVGLACRRLLLAKGVMEVYGENIIPQQAENLRLMQEAYRLGEVGILDIVYEQRKFVELNEEYISSRREAARSVVALESATGAELDGGKK